MGILCSYIYRLTDGRRRSMTPTPREREGAAWPRKVCPVVSVWGLGPCSGYMSTFIAFSIFCCHHFFSIELQSTPSRGGVAHCLITMAFSGNTAFSTMPQWLHIVLEWQKTAVSKILFKAWMISDKYSLICTVNAVQKILWLFCNLATMITYRSRVAVNCSLEILFKAYKELAKFFKHSWWDAYLQIFPYPSTL